MYYGTTASGRQFIEKNLAVMMLNFILMTSLVVKTFLGSENEESFLKNKWFHNMTLFGVDFQLKA